MRKSLFALAISGTVLPLTASAFGVSGLVVSSALNQPLQAEVKMFGVQNIPLNEITAELASQEAFDQISLSRSSELSAFNFKVTKNKNGLPVIKITSDKPISDPFVSFLIDIKWPNGQLYREYTLLLDPPQYAKTTETFTPQVSPPSVQPNHRLISFTDKSDSLSMIAKKVRPNPDLSINQTMVGILEANPSAFIDHNINRLKMGYNLKIPAASEIQSISKSDANKIVAHHNHLWRSWQEGGRDDANPGKLSHHFSLSPQPALAQAPTARSTATPQPIILRNEGNISNKVDTTFLSQDTSPVSAELSLRTALAASEEALTNERTQNQALLNRLVDLEHEHQSLNDLVAKKDQDLLALQMNMADKDKELSSIEQKITELQSALTTSASSGSMPSTKPMPQGNQPTLFSASQGSLPITPQHSSWWTKLLWILLAMGTVFTPYVWWRRKDFIRLESTVADDIEVAKDDILEADTAHPIMDDGVEEEIDEDEDELASVESITTKLDLAHAYLNMENFTEATTILQEVVLKGNHEQQAEAKKWLDRLQAEESV